MKNIILSFVLFLFAVAFSTAQNKVVTIHFPDTINEKEVTAHYSIKGLLNYFYEPYFNRSTTRNNYLSITIPDSIITFSLEIRPSNRYRWSGHTLLYLTSDEPLHIYLDTVNPPTFTGKQASLHQFMYDLKSGGGGERMRETQQEFVADSTTNSFFNFINKKIEVNKIFLDSLFAHKKINEQEYSFAKDQLTDEYLFRAALIGQLVDEKDRKYLSKINYANFCYDLDSIFKQYNKIYPWSLSTGEKAVLRGRGLISWERIELGLGEIYSLSSYLSREEQEIKAVSEIITNTAAGQLDSIKLNNQRNLFKEVFLNSIYNDILADLQPLIRKDYILANYSITNGLQEFGRLETGNLPKITQMFIGGKPVLVDFWATWCSPCIKEFEHRKELEEFLTKNNIGIIFVSLDFAGAYDQWKQVIERKQLEGFHYLGTPDFGNKLPYFENERGIPRYVLLDKDGSVLIEKCELPSSGKLISQIREKLGIEIDVH